MSIGHNSHLSLDAVVEENLLRGLFLAQRDALVRAVRDPALKQRHLIVLAEIIMVTNDKSGMAFPGRKYLSDVTGYPENTIATTVHELIKLEYLVSERRKPVGAHKALSHYSVVKPSVEQLQDAIAAHVATIRAKQAQRSEAASKPNARRWSLSDVNPAIDVNDSKVNSVVDVNNPVSGHSQPVNVNPVIQTVYNNNKSSSFVLTPEEEPKPKKGTRLPEEWALPNEWKSRVNSKYGPFADDALLREETRFRNYWLSQPGRKGSKTDWWRTWENWVLSALDYKRLAPIRTAGNAQSPGFAEFLASPTGKSIRSDLGLEGAQEWFNKHLGVLQ